MGEVWTGCMRRAARSNRLLLAERIGRNRAANWIQLLIASSLCVVYGQCHFVNPRLPRPVVTEPPRGPSKADNFSVPRRRQRITRYVAETRAKDRQGHRSKYPNSSSWQENVANRAGQPARCELPAGTEVRERHQPGGQRTALSDRRRPRP